MEALDSKISEKWERLPNKFINEMNKKKIKINNQYISSDNKYCVFEIINKLYYCSFHIGNKMNLLFVQKIGCAPQIIHDISLSECVFILNKIK